MVDPFTVHERSRIMQAIRGKDTKPEMLVRRLVESLGLGFRVHWRNLLGAPDIAFPSYRKVIFIQGCFWHRHTCRKGRSIPSTHKRFWLDKLARNRRRDAVVRRAINRLGWRVLTVWECQTHRAKLGVLERRIRRFLDSPPTGSVGSRSLRRAEPNSTDKPARRRLRPRTRKRTRQK